MLLRLRFLALPFGDRVLVAADLLGGVFGLTEKGLGGPIGTDDLAADDVGRGGADGVAREETGFGGGVVGG